MLRRASKTLDLRAQLNKALQREQHSEALDLYELIEKRKPDEARWPHRKGDLLLRMGRKREAAVAYERAVELYLAKGFEARAAATARLLATVDPGRSHPILQNGPHRSHRGPSRQV